MRTFMSSLPLNTYTPSPLKRTASTLCAAASVAARQLHYHGAQQLPATASQHAAHRCMRLVWYTSRLRPPL
jgi:hypothetical protein